jgi:cytosine/adenosine deaminase-related metal-dependent hydrolase
MDKFIIIKNGLVQTFDAESRTGYFNIIIKNDRIFKIDYENELSKESVIFSRYSGAQIIDAKDKLIIPSFINSFLNSSFSLSRFFLNICNYSNLNENVSLNLIEKYFANPENKINLKNLVAFTYFKSLYNGESCIVDTSKLINKDFLIENFKYNFLSSIDVVFATYENELDQFLDEHKIYHIIGIKNEDGINNYSLNSFKKLLGTGNKKLLFEVVQKPDSNELFRQTFSKSLVRVLKDNDLLSSKTIFVNPVFLHSEDIDNLEANFANVVICPSDLMRLAEKQMEIEDFFNNNINLSLGTGLTGFDILSEVKVFSNLFKKTGTSYESILKLVTTKAAKTFGKECDAGSIEQGKLANIIFFDLSVIHNLLNVPEIDSERISEFIIEYLTVKDISDVLIKGSFVKRNYQCKFYDPEMLKQIHCTLSKKVFEVGKYFEFKEKYMRRKRVKELSNRIRDTKETVITGYGSYSEEELISDNNDFISENEFKIIGTYKNDLSFNNSDIFGFNPERTVEILEINTLESGLKLFEEEEIDSGKSKENDSFNNSPVKKKQDIKASVQKVSVNSKEKEGLEKDDDKKVVFKKEKLRFGFSDDN